MVRSYKRAQGQVTRVKADKPGQVLYKRKQFSLLPPPSTISDHQDVRIASRSCQTPC